MTYLRRVLVIGLGLGLGLGLSCNRLMPDPTPYQTTTTVAWPQLRVEPHVGLSGQLAIATITRLSTLARPEWRWARLTVASPDGAVPVDSVWAVPSPGALTRQWRLSGEGPTIITLTLYKHNLTSPDWRTEFLLDTHNERLLESFYELVSGGGQPMEKTSKVNEAGNYTKPEMRKKLFEQIKATKTQGTEAGQWSARKAQVLAKRYKEKGGGYK